MSETAVCSQGDSEEEKQPLQRDNVTRGYGAFLWVHMDTLSAQRTHRKTHNHNHLNRKCDRDDMGTSRLPVDAGFYILGLCCEIW